MDTTISLKSTTYERLVRRKKHPRQSFDEVINEIVDEHSEGKKFEYKMEKIRRGNWMQAIVDLKSLGNEGWELCHFDNKKDKEGKLTGIFKRVKPNLKAEAVEATKE